MAFVVYLTAEELEELNAELLALLTARVPERLLDPSSRPAGALPVEIELDAYPIEPPEREG